MEMKKIGCYLTGIALSLTVVACGNNNQQASTTPAQQPQAAAETPAAPAAPAAPSVVTGKVLETMDASGYTYVQLETADGGNIWVAGPKTQLEIGEEVSVQGGSVMTNFSSKTLERTFDEIIFASALIRGGADQVSMPGADGGSFADAVQSADGAAGQASGGSASAVVPFAELKVDKAAGENAYNVGEVFSKAAELDTQKITVKGQVVKMSRNIMGKNWIHLQDGTGDPNSNTHDLVVTTMDEAEKGSVVTVEGVMAANKDFGSGYRYDAIIEDAVVLQ